jgi:hypothetical protein
MICFISYTYMVLKTAGYPGGLDCRQTASVVYGTVEASQPDKGKRNVCMISAVPLPMTG